MIKNLSLLILIVFAIVACSKSASLQLGDSSNLIKLDISIPLEKTKSEGTSTENAVNNFQIYVFDDNNKLEVYKKVDATTVTLECRPGEKRFVALANAPEIKSISDYETMQAQTSKLEENTIGNFVMIGEITTKVTEPSSVSIPVSRITAKIILGNIANNINLEYVAAKRFYVKQMYLINVAGSTNYLSDSATPELWYNKQRYDESCPVNNLVFKGEENSFVIHHNETYAANYVFYTYPNKIDSDSNQDLWSERFTRLVIEAYIDDEVQYYAVNLPDIKRNTAYKVNAKITRPGSNNPDIPVILDEIVTEIYVVNWNDAEDIDKEF